MGIEDEPLRSNIHLNINSEERIGKTQNVNSNH